MIDGVQQIKAHITLHTNGELILWPYGYTYRNVPPDMTTLDWKTFVALGRAQAAKNGYTAQQSSELYITDGDQIDWLYATYRIFTFTYELYPTETPTVWGDHYPDDSKIAAQTARNRGAILHLINRAACPYAALGADATRADCGPLFDDLEINRGWTRNAHGTDTADAGLWSVTNPSGTSSNGAKQLTTTYSGSKALVTGGPAGSSANTYDLDGGTTTIRSRPIRLPSNAVVVRAAHVPLLPRPRQQRLGRRLAARDRRGRGRDADRRVRGARRGQRRRRGTWSFASRSLADWKGQTIRIVVEATDGAATASSRRASTTCGSAGPSRPSLRGWNVRPRRRHAPVAGHRRSCAHARADRPRHPAGVGRRRGAGRAVGDRAGPCLHPAPGARPDPDRAQRGPRVAGGVRRAVRARPRR